MSEEEPILLGEGSHGCVFSSINCDNEQIKTELGENYVVKVLNKEDGEKEIKEYANLIAILAGIHNVEKYMVLKQKRCEYVQHNEVKKYITEHTSCKRPEIFIGYEYGGYELEKMLQPRYARVNLLKKNPGFYKELFVLFLYIIKALSILNTNSLSYFDFKPNNITYSKEKNVLKLIDIGSSTLTDQVNAEMIGKGIGTMGYMPPELLIFPSEKNDGVVNFFPGFFKFKNLSLKKEGGDKIILTSPELEELGSSINLTYYNKELSNYKRCYKSDMWSLGTTLLYLRSLAYDDKEEEEDEEYKLEKIDFTGLDELIIALLQLDVDRRIDSVSALEMYKTWIIGTGMATEQRVEQIVNPDLEVDNTSGEPNLVLEGGRNSRRRRRRHAKNRRTIKNYFLKKSSAKTRRTTFLKKVAQKPVGQLKNINTEYFLMI